jgi:hypothetical protein
MATITVSTVAHATLTTTTVDTVELTSGFQQGARVWNLSGAAQLWVTYGASATATATPTVGGDGCLIVPAGLWRLANLGSIGSNVFVKILGNGNEYVVELV